jgi:dipeptidyl aminopeptidase/acylaminoacyl peptidase
MNLLCTEDRRGVSRVLQDGAAWYPSSIGDSTMRLAARLLVLVSIVVPSLGAAQPRPLAIEDYYRLRTVGAPQISPDGNWVAFTVSRRIEAINDDSSSVFIVATSRSLPPREVSTPGTHATNPQWQPDGQVTFAASGRRWSVDPARTGAPVEVPLVAQAAGGTAVARVLASPDGRRTAIVRNMPVTIGLPEYASAFEKRHEERFRGHQFDWLDFQRDGQRFPVPDRTDPRVNPPQEIFLDASGEARARQLTRLGLRPTGVEWSPDGATLLFVADSSYREERKYGASQVYIVSTEGAVRRISGDSESSHSGARFSPDGRWVLYTKQLSTDAVIARKLNHGGATDLVLVPASGGAERVLTSAWDLLPSNAFWSADSRFVYFTGGTGGATHLFRVPAAGGPVTQVTQGERRITNVSVNKATTAIAYTVGLIETPPEVYVAAIDGSGERKLSNVHGDFTREIALSRADRLLFPSKDGTPIEGWLTLPHGYRRDGGPYPLVVINHGGPHAADGYAFDFKSQYLAANGYLVLKVNFRSSTGYGEKFLWGTWGAWGDRDGEDVMAGIDHVIARYPVAASRVATMGHSYGGFMTNWLITQYPDRFAAAIPGAGIVNWVSDYGTADIARTKETEFFGYPWEAKPREIMIRQSPLTYAGRVKTPTLFIHGEVDQRVPYSEAEQMYVALKKLGVPAKMIQYAGMAHGITGSWNNVHRMLAERAWLDRYLKAPATP